MDIYFGGQRVGETAVVYQPGAFRFQDVEALLALLPKLVNPALVRQNLADPHLDPHTALVCMPGQSSGCGEFSPSLAGIIFDQQRFRVDIFIAPEQLQVRPGIDRAYLDAPPMGLALVDSIAGTVAGSEDGRTVYTVQNRAVLGDGSARLRSETSASSDAGFRVETLAAELDRPDRRYSAGLFWTPGMDLLGRRKLLGIGIGSQIDTRLDKYLLEGSPLILFLPRRARVDILRDGRLLASRTYEAGNQNLDTSALPSGSYDLTLRIQETGASSREEHRFFIKNALIAPMGQTLFYAYGGVLANDSDRRPIGITSTPYFQGSVARRLTSRLAIDASVIGVGDKLIGEIGGYIFTGIGQFRAAGLASNSGDAGVLVQGNSLGRSAFGYAFDVRRVWSHDGAPIVPLNNFEARSFDLAATNAPENTGGSFTQINANVTYRLGLARLGISGYYRRDRQDMTYAVGPTAYWPVLRKRGLELAVDGRMTQSSQGRNGYLGLTLQLLRSHTSLNGTVGVRSSNGSGPETEAKGGLVAEVGGSWEREDTLGGDFSVAGAFERTPDEVAIRGSANMRGPYGSAFIDANSTLSGVRHGTQYSASFQTSLAATDEGVTIGGKEVGEGSIVVRVDGKARDTVFEVLVDESSRGQLRAGSALPLFLTPYRHYDVRIRPVNGDRASYDGRTRTVSIYPGTVAKLEWKAEPVVTTFGRAVWPDGTPVADANITATAGIGQTDGQGYFQVETGTSDMLKVQARDGRVCRLSISTLRATNGFAALGEQQCQAMASAQYAQRSSP
ncbi:TcfC E-set like domain-containing protein [Sphingomonas sp.]|uniref:TcfC E-set like domain-containing protein n=1 Tax=Sphingomonas sp. TaxID=28214 RepID=UPI00307E12DE